MATPPLSQPEQRAGRKPTGIEKNPDCDAPIFTREELGYRSRHREAEERTLCSRKCTHEAIFAASSLLHGHVLDHRIEPARRNAVAVPQLDRQELDDLLSSAKTFAAVHSTRVFFFFSSRRRHTRCSRDWSSDVCSSDLAMDMPRPVPTPTGLVV